MSLPLQQRGDDIKITEELLKVAAMNEHSRKEVMSLLLEQRRDEITTTEEAFKAAAETAWGGKDVISLLVDERLEDTTACLGDSVCLAAAACGQRKVLDLPCPRIGFRPLKGERILMAAFYNAAKSGDVESVRKLLCEGTQLDMKNIRFVTTLWIAAAQVHRAVVDLLVQREDVNAISLRRCT